MAVSRPQPPQFPSSIVLPSPTEKSISSQDPISKRIPSLITPAQPCGLDLSGFFWQPTSGSCDGYRSFLIPASANPVTISGRKRTLFGLGFIVTAGSTALFKYQSDVYRSNELAQQQLKAPNGYVSVDRSGGGV
ncbi:hypothetical protein NLG97_g9373 [Lecanicillium saksenae]|uniref:Uncharacterized protein n=1 Tax=Lecanicillium saksenae TaxID=468837 RepID=A0ACC1QGQ7_9HYPO|nr:hypothetical protein NLG97_g9373 [Lecanicillium saksenae]